MTWSNVRAEDVVDEADNDVIRFIQPRSTTPLQFLDSVWMKILRGPHFYQETDLYMENS